MDSEDGIRDRLQFMYLPVFEWGNWGEKLTMTTWPKGKIWGWKLKINYTQKKWEPGFSCTKEESFWIGVKIPDGSELSNLYLSKSSFARSLSARWNAVLIHSVTFIVEQHLISLQNKHIPWRHCIAHYVFQNYMYKCDWYVSTLKLPLCVYSPHCCCRELP